MAQCVKCGQEAETPVWAEYADPAFAHKWKYAFPLHDTCLDEDLTITGAEWVRTEDVTDETVIEEMGDLTLVEIPDQPRYQEVEAPE